MRVNVLIVLAHPNPASFNHAIARACAEAVADNGHGVVFHDLCQEGFAPLLPAEEFGRDAALDPVLAGHCAELAAADGIVIVHPNWWGQPPAILTGWVDRVVRPGVAYEFLEGDGGEGVPRGLLRAKAALVFNTSNTDASRERTVFGDPLEAIWRQCIFGLCGVRTVHRRTFGIVVTSTATQRAAWLDEVRETAKRFFPRDWSTSGNPRRRTRS